MIPGVPSGRDAGLQRTQNAKIDKIRMLTTLVSVGWFRIDLTYSLFPTIES